MGNRLEWQRRIVALMAACTFAAAMTPALSLAEEEDSVVAEVTAEDGSPLSESEPEEVLETTQGNEYQDESVTPLDEPLMASEGQEIEPVNDEGDEAAGKATTSEVTPEEDVNLEAQLTKLDILKADGNWNKRYLDASDIAAYQESHDTSDLTFNIWIVSIDKKCTLNVDALSEGANFEFYLSETTNETIGDFVNVKPNQHGSISEELEPGIYYINLVSIAPGGYAIRAYTTNRSLSSGATYNGSASITSLGKKAYTGTQIKPKVNVAWKGEKLVQDVDYTVSYTSNIKVGTAKVTITGKGLYQGTKALTFKIVKRSIKKCKVTLGTQAWTGRAIKAKPVVKIGKGVLKSGTDYRIVKYTDNRHIGTATVTLKGKGGLKGTRTVKFKIRYDVSKVGNVIGFYKEGNKSFSKFVYKKTNTVMVKGRDYRLSVYLDDSTRKTYKLVGKGDYSGTAYFTIKK